MSDSRSDPPSVALLGKSDDEVGVISVAARELDGSWWVQAGSVLIGPPDMAIRSWPEWEAENQVAPNYLDHLLANAGRPLPTWIEFDEHVGSWRFLRGRIAVKAIDAWLSDAARNGGILLQVAGTDLELRIDLQPATSLARILTHETTPARRLACAAARPLLGWRHPLGWPEPNPSSEVIDLPEVWTVDRHSIPGAPAALVGITSNRDVPRPDGTPSPPLEPGLLVARLHSPAWLGRLRYESNEETFHVGIILDPSRIAMWDLTLDIEEREGFDLRSARRVRLGDLALPPPDEHRLLVRLPTLGPGITRRVRLFDGNGVLLDGTDWFNVLEQIQIGGRVGDEELVSAAVGHIDRPNFEERLARTNHVEEQFAQMLADGASGRVVVPGASGVSVIRDRLRAVRGELAIFDPYFGKQDTDWDVLIDVTAPIRVLTGSQGKRSATHRVFHAPSIDIRRWRGSAPNPPFHDRAYLWEGGGLVVGTSPTGLGNRLSMIDTLSEAVAAELLKHFEIWWLDPDFNPI